MTGTWTHTVADSCPWPDRRGLRCRIIAEPPVPVRGGVYPWAGRLPSERVVLVEDDPFPAHHDGVWSCVLYATDLTPIEDGSP